MFLIDKVKGAGAGTVDRIDENFNAGRSGLGFGLWKSKCIGLHIAIYGGVSRDGSGDLIQVDPYEFDASASTTYYIYIDHTTGLPTNTTSAPAGWPDISPDIPLHNITTGASTIDWDNDWQEWKASMAAGSTVTKADILGLLGFDDLTISGDDITITIGAKSVVLTVT